MNVIILQHIPIEDPGYIKKLMEIDGWQLTTIELDQGERIPQNLQDFDAMLCMGGPMDTWMEEDHPWLIHEKQQIKEYVVHLEKPFLGFCLGAQLLGEVVGGQVVRSTTPEIGVLPIHLNPIAENDALLQGIPLEIQTVQWHSYEVQGLESHPDVHVLASSTETKFQVFRYKNHAYGIQFHIEVKQDTVQTWGEVPEYKQALESSLGLGAIHSFDQQAQQQLTEMNKHCKIMYDNFKKMITEPRR